MVPSTVALPDEVKLKKYAKGLAKDAAAHSPLRHRERRAYAREQIRALAALMQAEPGMLGPKLPMVCRAVLLCCWDPTSREVLIGVALSIACRVWRPLGMVCLAASGDGLTHAGFHADLASLRQGCVRVASLAIHGIECARPGRSFSSFPTARGLPPRYHSTPLALRSTPFVGVARQACLADVQWMPDGGFLVGVCTREGGGKAGNAMVRGASLSERPCVKRTKERSAVVVLIMLDGAAALGSHASRPLGGGELDEVVPLRLALPWLALPCLVQVLAASKMAKGEVVWYCQHAAQTSVRAQRRVMDEAVSCDARASGEIKIMEPCGISSLASYPLGSDAPCPSPRHHRGIPTP